MDGEQISKAINAHSLWKGRLGNIINTGKADLPVATIRQDDQCEFGKWLYTSNGAVKADPHYEAVRRMHADFHTAAAEIAQWAVTGRKAEALAEMNNGRFAKSSTQLTHALLEWKRAVKA